MRPLPVGPGSRQRRAGGAFASLALIFSLALVVTQAQQPRDAARQSGATVSGRVVDAGGAPVSGATIKIGSMSWRATATSGADGQFTFTGVPDDRMHLTAERSGYAAAVFGGPPGSSGGGRLVVAGDVGDLTLVMARLATVSGTLLGPDGAPVAGIALSLANAGAGGGLHGNGGQSDAAGRFTITGVYPGRYRIVAPYYLHALALPRGAQPPIYHPGTVDPAAATLLKVESSEAHDLAPFRITPTPVGRVTGVVLQADGTPAAGARVVLDNGSGLQRPALDMPPDPAGRFVFSHVPPGRYRLSASIGEPAQGPLAVALQDVDVGAAGLADLVVTLGPAGRFAGRVRFSGAETPPDVETVRVFVGAAGYIPRPVAVRADGSFEHTFFPGLHVITAHATAPDKKVWHLESALSGGVDLLERGMDFAPGSMNYTGVELTLSDTSTNLSGTVWSDSGAPTNDAWVVVFPVERRAWHPGLHRVLTVRPDSDGTYSLTILSPGNYLVALADRLDLSSAERADRFLESLVPKSTSVTIGTRGAVTMDLRRTGG